MKEEEVTCCGHWITCSGDQRSTPVSALAYDAGEVANLLEEFNFPSTVRKSLSELEANSFDSFALQAYQWILNHTGPGDAGPDPWPTQGLPEVPMRAERRGQAA